MLGKLMKWFSSDRSEEPRTTTAEVSPSRILELRASAVEHFKVYIDEPTLREMVRLLQKQQKIEAIKKLRLATRGLELKEANDIADHLEELLQKA